MASPRLAFGRVLVLAASSTGIIAALIVLALSWPAPAELFMARFSDSTSTSVCLLVLGIAMLIAWREGNHAPNIAIALSLTFIYGSVVVTLLFDRLQVMPPHSAKACRCCCSSSRLPSTSARHSSFRAS
jgi:hypothetical protein